MRRDPESRPIDVSTRMGPCLVMIIDIQSEHICRATQNIDVRVDPLLPETLTLTLIFSCVHRDPESRPIDVSARMGPCLVMAIDIQS